MDTVIEVRNLSGRQIDEGNVLRAAREALQAEGAKLRECSIALVDDDRILSLNRRLLGRDRTTDVIAFEADDDSGEVIVSVDTARRQAGEVGHSLSEELAYLVVHGVLHVLGWEDCSQESRRAMLERQNAILGIR